MFLIGETLAARAGNESAKAVVVLMPAERQVERRAEESRMDHSLSSDPEGAKATEMMGSRNCGSYRIGATNWGRWILSGCGAWSCSLASLRRKAEEGI